MTETNPYRSPVATSRDGTAPRTHHNRYLCRLLLLGVGAATGALVALPLLMKRAAWAFALPIIGAALGAFAARVAFGPTRGTRKFALCGLFLVCGPIIGLSIGFLGHILVGEPLIPGSLGPFLMIGAIVGVTGAIGTALMRLQ